MHVVLPEKKYFFNLLFLFAIDQKIKSWLVNHTCDIDIVLEINRDCLVKRITLALLKPFYV